jgi:hypothetical protein
MSKFDTEKLIKYLNSKWGPRPCPMCGSGPWKVQGSIFQLMEYNEGAGLVIGGPIIPVVPVICANCGNTILVNAVISDVVNPSVPPSKEEPK